MSVAKRRKVSNRMALPVLGTIAERPMHPYEIATLLRERGKDQSVRINWGSLYTVVRNLEKHGFIEATGTDRHGRRPERTVYRITEAGLAEFTDWLRELLSTPQKEYPAFETALSLLPGLSPDEVVDLLEQRLQILRRTVAEHQEVLDQVSQTIPRLFLVEVEYYLAMQRAEIAWVESLVREIRDGTMPDVDGWRKYHETGELPPDFLHQPDREAETES